MSLYIKGLFSPKPGPAFHNLSLLVFHTPQFHSNFHCFILPSSFCPSPQQDTKQTTGKAFILQCCKIGWVHRKMLKKNKTKHQKGNPILSRRTHGLIPGLREDKTARLHSQGLARTPSCMAAGLPSCFQGTAWITREAWILHTVTFMHLGSAIHIPTPTLLLKVNQGQEDGETRHRCMSKISRCVNPAVARYTSHSHLSLVCSTLPPWMGVESRCSDWHLLKGCSWCSTWFAPSIIYMPDFVCMGQQSFQHTDGQAHSPNVTGPCVFRKAYLKELIVGLDFSLVSVNEEEGQGA